MLWNSKETYTRFDYQKEEELEDAIQIVKSQLFGPNRIYFDDKRRIGAKGKTLNIPDGYLIDLSDTKTPKIFVVENDLFSHQPIKHIAVQILEFSLSFESSKVKVKNVIKDSLQKSKKDWHKCEYFAINHGYENVDFLLESIIQKSDSFKAMLIIDEISEELETVLISRFNFSVEILTLKRFKSNTGKILYDFEPFLLETTKDITKVEFYEIDTIVVPARDEGFQEVFIGENCWYAIKLNPSMIPKIKYIAAYQIAPISAITHIAKVKDIKQWKDSNKYILYFSEKAKKIKSVKLGKNKGKVPQSPRYSSRKKIIAASSIDNVF